MSEHRYLIAYFSWSGNAKKAAGMIEKVTGGDMFEIEPEKKYSKMYPVCAAKAKIERDKNKRPAVKGRVGNMEQYTDIIIGYPAWWYTCPMIILSFLEQYDFTGKTIYLFNTHLGSGALGTEDVRNACNGTVIPSIDANNLTEDRIKKWLGL